ncbi:hypothetical protein BKA58DRAFT_390962 [Alternaria rosae]|uniref:uncharacterized protein n=1 Tax=Alternaria rosae TaxID=1187941 RepID=UPI001E8E1CDC|nr:uncharacterized protein BKA58DRAFT_390962 [Alternaria rosae]KAH6864865.1 hypothetical protein BKA58DRAFT_390962 [Alternaria rosae]
MLGSALCWPWGGWATSIVLRTATLVPIQRIHHHGCCEMPNPLCYLTARKRSIRMRTNRSYLPLLAPSSHSSILAHAYQPRSFAPADHSETERTAISFAAHKIRDRYTGGPLSVYVGQIHRLQLHNTRD